MPVRVNLFNIIAVRFVRLVRVSKINTFEPKMLLVKRITLYCVFIVWQAKELPQV